MIGRIDMRFLSSATAASRSPAAIELATRDIALRDLRRHLPYVEGVALAFAATAENPVAQRDDLEIGLLPRIEVNPSGLVEIATVAVYGDVILAGRHIAIESAPRLRHTHDRLVHPQIRGARAVVIRPSVAVEPNPRLARRDRRNGNGSGWRELGASRSCQKEDTNDDRPNRHAFSFLGAGYPRSPAAIEPAARDIALRDLRRHLPYIEGVALAVASHPPAGDPVTQRDDLEKGLLPRSRQ